MYDLLLFLHLLAAFASVTVVVLLTTIAIVGAPALPLSGLARRLWDIGGAGTLVFGVWLALNVGYSLLDGWILAALVLWIVAAGTGTRVGIAFQEAQESGTVVIDSRLRAMHIVMAVAVLLLHVGGAMLLVGSLVTVAGLAIVGRRGDSAALMRLAFRTLLFGVIPSYLLMRVGAELIFSKENVDDEATWVSIGYIASDLGALLIIIATIVAGVGRKSGGSRSRVATTALTLIVLTAYVIAIWAMAAKPG